MSRITGVDLTHKPTAASPVPWQRNAASAVAVGRKEFWDATMKCDDDDDDEEEEEEQEQGKEE